jgi:hypothetical protein
MIFTATPTAWEEKLKLPLTARLAPTPPEIVEFIGQYKQQHGLSNEPAAASADNMFIQDICQAIDEIPLSIQKALGSRLLGIYFMEGIGSSAITDVIAYANRELIGSFIVIDLAELSALTGNQWATLKENNPFTSEANIRLETEIASPSEDNRKAALLFLLLHEFGHVLSSGRDFHPDVWLDTTKYRQTDAYRFLPLSWQISAKGNISPLPEEDFPLREEVVFYGNSPLLGKHIPAIYGKLSQSSFPTLYAATSVFDDFAECFASYVHSEILGKPYITRITVQDEPLLEISNFWHEPRSHHKAAFLKQFLQDLPQHKPSYQFNGPENRKKLIQQAETQFLGLAPFLKLSIAEVDLRLIAQPLLELAGAQNENANLWMNLSTVMFAIGQRDAGLSIQEQALQMASSYELPGQPSDKQFQLLVINVAGDIAENTPIDCLLMDGVVALSIYYATASAPLPTPLPPHDAILVAISDSLNNRMVLNALTPLLAQSARPVLNFPQFVPNTERAKASSLLQGISGLAMPSTHQVIRASLLAVSEGRTTIDTLYSECRFPLILRPVGSQAGRDLARINDTQDIGAYLQKVPDAAFYVSRFIDYSGTDSFFRKYRVALIDGQPYACHMAISSHWMIHYVNAGMYEEAAKRLEEETFMVNFSDFARKHEVALSGISQRSGLDYVCIDCAETRDGELLIFEIDHTMVVHAMDPVDLFPYKKIHMLKVRKAFENLLSARQNTY